MKQLLNVDCVIFDLDDTLYPQIEFDLGCLKKAARYIAVLCHKKDSEIFGILKGIVLKNGIEYRQIFDDLFKEIKFDGMRFIKEILNHYWSAKPQIVVFPDTFFVLDYLKDKYDLAIITDGYPDIQQYKINTLGLSKYFDKILFTDNYGVDNRKPSRYVFDVFLKETQFLPEKCVYIGNDPQRDFYPARKSGMHTVRIKQGSFAGITLGGEYEADYTVNNISQLIELV